MSDSPEDRRFRGRRGSLLDHARDPEPPVPEPANAPDRAPESDVPAAVAPASSLLVKPSRAVRVSTARYAPPGPEAQPARPSASILNAAPSDSPSSARSDGPAFRQAQTPVSAASARTSRPGPKPPREKFGDRIARLIGTITPEEKSATPDTAPQGRQPEPEPAPAPLVHDVPPAEVRPEPVGATPERDRSYAREDRFHWDPAPAAGRYEDGSRPLLDASILIAAVWRFRRIIAVCAFLGAVIGVLMALSTPHKYYAESRLFVDPREIRVTEDDIRNQQLSTEAMLAITDSQLQILSSTSVLEKVIEDLGLDRDPEFNGSMSSGGISGGLSVLRQIISGSGGGSENEQKALNNLREALSVARDTRTFIIIVGVSTRDPEKSALIANQIVETYLDSEGQAQSNLLERTSESIDTRLNSLRADLDAAERAVERYKAENGLVGVGGEFIDDKVILALSDQLANARAMKVGIRVKADNLAKVKIDDVLSGAFPEELLSTNLSELRKQYTQTKSNAEALATRLGPRHPQYIAAMQSLETITREISAELRRIVASSQTELQRAVETEQELASQMAVAKSRAIDQSVELVTLRELERKANATRGIYEAFLTRSRETSERSNLSTRNVRVISPAEAPLVPMGPSRKIIVVAGMLAGFLGGVGLALLVGAIESIRAYNRAQLRYPGPASGGYPERPTPGPTAPSGGPGSRNRFVEDRPQPSRREAPGTGPASDAVPVAQAGAGEMADNDDAAARPKRRNPFRFAVLRPRQSRPASAQPDAAEPVQHQSQPAPDAAPPAESRPRQAADTVAASPVADHRHATGQNARAFLSSHGQPQPAQAVRPEPQAWPADPAATAPHWQAQPAHHPQPHYPQPAYPGAAASQPQPPMHPAPQPHIQPQHPYHQPYPAQPYQSGYPAEPYARGFADARQPHYGAAYPVPGWQPPLVPAPLYPAHPYAVEAYPAGAYPAPAQTQAVYHQPVHQHPSAGYQPHPPMPIAPAAQPHQAAAPVAPSAPQPAAEPARNEAQPSAASAQRTAPHDDEAVDRIRRDMADLRARIDTYGTARRSA